MFDFKKAADADQAPAPIVFETREVDGERKTFVSAPWPQFAVFSEEALAKDPYVEFGKGELTIDVANGYAVYVKYADGVDAKEGETTFKLLDSTFELPPEVETPAPQAGDEPTPDATVEALDTHAEGEGAGDQEFAHTRLSEQVTTAERAAMRSGDYALHAGLHALETAIGEFKRACTAGAPFFAEDSVEHAVLLEIVNTL